MMRAEQERTKIVHDLNRRIFEKFSNRHQEWETVIHCLKILDVLCSLAEYARTYAEDLCIPEIDPFDDGVCCICLFYKCYCLCNLLCSLK